MIRLALAVAAMVLLVAGCPPGPVTPPPDAADAAPLADAGPQPGPDDAAPIGAPDGSTDAPSPPAPDVDAGNDDCARAEATIVRLACVSKLGQPLAKNKHGVPFAVTCRQDAAAKPPLDLHPACIARATTCPAVLNCGL